MVAVIFRAKIPNILCLYILQWKDYLLGKYEDGFPLIHPLPQHHNKQEIVSLHCLLSIKKIKIKKKLRPEGKERVGDSSRPL